MADEMDKNDYDATEVEDVADAGDEEEEVELFSAEALTSPSVASSLGERLALSPRRCISKELLDQMPTLSINTRYYEVSISKPFGVFHLMQLIEKSIQVGALFSPKLFVPKEVWQQDRVKLAGISLKVVVFQQLKQELEKISMLLPLSSENAIAAFTNELDAFLEVARAERILLARSFPFLSVDKANQAQDEHNALSPPSTGSGGSMGIGKLTNLAYGFGRMVKKQAIAAVERVGSAQPISVSFDELEEYAAILSMFFNSTRSIEHLLGLSAAADGTQEEVHETKEHSQLQSLDPIILSKLSELAIFLNEVVIELVMRDIQILLESYIRRTTQHFGEFRVEHALLKYHSSMSA